MIVVLSIPYSREKGETASNCDDEYSGAFSARSQGEHIVNSERRDEQGGAKAYAGRGAARLGWGDGR